MKNSVKRLRQLLPSLEVVFSDFDNTLIREFNEDLGEEHGFKETNFTPRSIENLKAIEQVLTKGISVCIITARIESGKDILNGIVRLFQRSRFPQQAKFFLAESNGNNIFQYNLSDGNVTNLKVNKITSNINRFFSKFPLWEISELISKDWIPKVRGYYKTFKNQIDKEFTLNKFIYLNTSETIALGKFNFNKVLQKERSKKEFEKLLNQKVQTVEDIHKIIYKKAKSFDLEVIFHSRDSLDFQRWNKVDCINFIKQKFNYKNSIQIGDSYFKDGIKLSDYSMLSARGGICIKQGNDRQKEEWPIFITENKNSEENTSLVLEEIIKFKEKSV